MECKKFEYDISMMGKYAVDDEMTLCILSEGMRMP